MPKIYISLIARKFLIPNNSLRRRVLPNEEKLEFVKTSVSWIEGKDIIDTCLLLNFGYDAPLPWPQVIRFTCLHKRSLPRFDDSWLSNRLGWDWLRIQRMISSLFLEATDWMFPVPAQLSLLQVSYSHTLKKRIVKVTFYNSGKYIRQVDRVMTQVDRITEDIAHMPVAAFIFRDKESDEVHYSTDIRWTSYKSNDLKKSLSL